MAPSGDSALAGAAGSAFTPVAPGSRPRLLGKSLTANGQGLEGLNVLGRGHGAIVAPLSSLLEAAGPCVDLEMARLTESISWLYDAVKTLEERGTVLGSQFKRLEGTLETCLESMTIGDTTGQGSVTEDGAGPATHRSPAAGDGPSPELLSSPADKDFRRLLRQQDHKRAAENRIFEMKLDNLKGELASCPSFRDLEALKVTVQEKVDAAEQRIREDVSMLGGLLNEEGAADRRRMLSQFEAFQKRQDKQFDLCQDKLKELVGQALQPLSDRLAAQEVLALTVEALEERVAATSMSPPGTATTRERPLSVSDQGGPGIEHVGADGKTDGGEGLEAKDPFSRRLSIVEARLQALLTAAGPAASMAAGVSGVTLDGLAPSARASLISVAGCGAGNVEGAAGTAEGAAPDGASPTSPDSPASPAGFGGNAFPLESTAQFGGSLAWSGSGSATALGAPMDLLMTLGPAGTVAGNTGEAAGAAAAAGGGGFSPALQQLFVQVQSELAACRNRLEKLESMKDEAALPDFSAQGEDATQADVRPSSSAAETAGEQASQRFQTEGSDISRSVSRNGEGNGDQSRRYEDENDDASGARHSKASGEDGTAPKSKSPRAPAGLGDAIHENEDHGAPPGPRRSPMKRKDRGSAAERGGRSGRPGKAGESPLGDTLSAEDISSPQGATAAPHRPPPSRPGGGGRGRGRSPGGQNEDRIAELETQLEEVKRQEAHKQRSHADNVNRLRRSVELLAKYVIGHQGETSSPTNSDPLMWLEKTRHDRAVFSVDMRLRELEGNADGGGSVKERVKKVEHAMGTMDLEYLRQVKPEFQNFKDEQEAVQSDLHREVKELKVLVGCLEACIPQDTRKAVQLFKRAAGIDGHQEGPKTAIQLQLEGKILSLQEEMESRLRKAENKINGQCDRVSTVVRDLERKQERFDNHLAIVTEKVGGTTWRASATSGQPSPRSSCTPLSDATRGTRRGICRASTPEIPQGARSSTSLAIPHRSTSEVTSEGPESIAAQSVAEKMGAAGWTKSVSSVPPTPTPPKTS